MLQVFFSLLACWCPFHLIVPDLIIFITLGEEYVSLGRTNLPNFYI
jgi:hypothetical protein